jgi:eukaryotic-like serine/threonine-protein kinase
MAVASRVPAPWNCKAALPQRHRATSAALPRESAENLLKSGRLWLLTGQPMLSSHPLPVGALAASSLRRIFTETPPSPRVKSRRSEGSEAKPVRRAVAGRYRLDVFLESGGTADVYAAVDLASSRRVAIKVLREEAAQSPVLREHFLTGARAAMRIEHDHVVRVLAVRDRRAMKPYAVMELLEGKPLDALMTGGRALAPELALELCRQAAIGLDAAHRLGVVHCDIKPENLFVTAGPERTPRLKILDFDLANVDGACDPGEAHVLRGTAKYMAPEQIVGDPVDARTDVYGLGVVLFRMLSGQLPFDLPLGATLLRHQLYSALPPVSWLVEGLDPRLEAVVKRATRKDAERRYPTMAALLDDLHACSAGAALAVEPERAGPDRYSPRTPRGIENELALRPEAWPTGTSGA